VVSLFEGKSPMPEEEGARDAQLDPSYRAWLGNKPIPGEVFVETGEASATDRQKLLWKPTKYQRELIKRVIDHETAMVNKLYMDQDQDSYAQRIETLVEETMRDVMVDPTTLKRLPDAPDQSPL
jgi:hypothetical protein